MTTNDGVTPEKFVVSTEHSLENETEVDPERED
jgi:hypothetical protein